MKTTVLLDDPELRKELFAIYEEIMWLAKRPNVTASCARSWYTHVTSERIKRRLRRFTGKVSLEASKPTNTPLRLEHFKRIQTTLTMLVERHRVLESPDPEEFLRVLCECEQVHIVTFEENYAAMRANGNYLKAGIDLVPWRTLSSDRKVHLWRKMLRGKVSNAMEYEPGLS